MLKPVFKDLLASSLLLAYIYIYMSQAVFILLLLMNNYPVAIVGSRIIKTGLNVIRVGRGETI